MYNVIQKWHKNIKLSYCATTEKFTIKRNALYHIVYESALLTT